MKEFLIMLLLLADTAIALTATWCSPKYVAGNPDENRQKSILISICLGVITLFGIFGFHFYLETYMWQTIPLVSLPFYVILRVVIYKENKWILKIAKDYTFVFVTFANLIAATILGINLLY